jgi:hypothetical protein
MPLFIFTCTDDECGFSKRGLGEATDERVCPECGVTMLASLPKNLNSVTMEMKDSYRGVQHFKNQAEMVKERNTHHHDNYEIAEKIDKYGMDEAKRNGWDKKAKQK